MCGIRKLLSAGAIIFNLTVILWGQGAFAGNVAITEAWENSGLKFEHLKVYYSTSKCYQELKYFHACIEMTNVILKQFDPAGFLLPIFALHEEIPGVQFVANDYSKAFGPASVVYPKVIQAVPSLHESYQRMESDRKRFYEYWEKVFEVYPEQIIPFDELLNWTGRYFVSDHLAPFVAASALNAFTRTYYDPHTEFIPIEILENKAKSNTIDEFFGIGITYVRVQDKIVVKEVLPGGSAEKAGVQERDVLLSISNADTSFEITPKTSLSQVSDRLAGKQGSKLSIKVMRNRREFIFLLTRGPVSLYVVKQKMINNQKIAHIQIQEMFMDPGYFCDTLALAMAKSHGNGAQGIILDLRSNRGGFLQNAVCIANFFIPPGANIFKATRRDGVNSDMTTTSHKVDLFSWDKPLVVLINSDTASSSEIVAGALQENADLHKLPYFVVGERSHGKGSFQSTAYAADFPLGDELRKTIAFRQTQGLFYLPSMRTPQIEGILPDFEAFSIPNPTEVQKFRMREENRYMNVIKNPNTVKWQRSEQSQTQIRNIQDCMKTEGAAHTAFESESLVTEPDYQKLVAIDVLNCAGKLGIKSESDSTPTQLLQEVWTKYRTQLDSLP
jgi:C-terminal peptidase prc